MKKILSLYLFALLLLSSCAPKDKVEEMAADRPAAPEGMVPAGTVHLDTFSIDFEVPISLYARFKDKQWIANSRKGEFRLVIALFDDPEKPTSPLSFVKNRGKQLTGKYFDPKEMTAEELLPLGGKEGYKNVLIVESTDTDNRVVSSRFYLIESVVLDDGSTLVVSADVFSGLFEDGENSLEVLARSLRLQVREQEEVGDVEHPVKEN